MLLLQGAKHPLLRRDANGGMRRALSPLQDEAFSGIFQEFHLAGLTLPAQRVHCTPSIQVSSKWAAASLCTVWKIFSVSHFGPDSSVKCDLTLSAPEQKRRSVPPAQYSVRVHSYAELAKRP